MRENRTYIDLDCECGAEIARFEQDEELDVWWIYLYTLHASNLPWRRRVSLIWQILTGGLIEMREIVVGNKQLQKFVEEVDVRLKETSKKARQSAEQGDQGVSD